MNHCRSLRPVQHDDLQQTAGAIRAENQVPQRIFSDFVDNERQANCVVDVVCRDAVPKRGSKNLHDVSYYETRPRPASIDYAPGSAGCCARR